MTKIELTTYSNLDERIVVIRAGDLVDAVFVRTQRFNVLVDTLDTPEACRFALEQLGPAVRDRPLIVVNSHMDWDHFWGNSAIADQAVIVAHQRALERFRTPSVQETLRLKSQEDARYRAVTLCPPTLTFPDRLRLEGGDLTLELFPTPGHTPDHIAIWIPELRVCLAVDAAESPIPEVGSDDPRDLEALIASLRAIRALDARHVILAHGQTSSPATVHANLAYFATLAERVEKLGATIDDLIDAPVREGLGLWDLIPLPPALSSEAKAFYEKCHSSNLRATANSIPHRRPGGSAPTVGLKPSP